MYDLMYNSITFMDRLRLAKFVLTADRFTNGPKVREFEAKWSEWLGCKYSLFVSSGSTANFLLMAAIREMYPDRKKVLLPACTWVTNVGPVIQLGFEPVFCDVNLTDFSFDLDGIPKEAPDIVFMTHLLGLAGPLEELKKMYPNALFIEDICESHGVSNGTKYGSDSLGATFSFYFGHHMTTVEGGMVCTNNKELHDLMRLKRSHGLARELGSNPKEFLFLTDGYNFRNTEIGAVLGISQLPRLDSIIEHRRKNYLEFHQWISNISDVYTPGWHPGNSSFCLPIVFKTRERYLEFVKYLDDRNIEHRTVVGGNLLRQPFLRHYPCNFPNADIIHNQGLYLGNSQFLDVSALIRDLNPFFNICPLKMKSESSSAIARLCATLRRFLRGLVKSKAS